MIFACIGHSAYKVEIISRANCCNEKTGERTVLRLKFKLYCAHISEIEERKIV